MNQIVVFAVCGQVIGLRFDCLLVGTDRVVFAPDRGQRSRQRVMGLKPLGFQSDGSAEGGDGVLVALQRMQHGAAIVVRIVMIRGGGHSRIQSLEGIFVVAFLVEHGADLDLRRPIIGCDCNNASIGSHGFFAPVQGAADDAEIEPGFGIIGFEHDRPAISFLGSGRILSLIEKVTKIVMQHGFVGRQPDSVLQQGFCLAELALVPQQHCQRVQHRNRGGLLAQQLTAQLFGLGRLSRPPELLDARERDLKIRWAGMKRNHGRLYRS